MASAVKSRRSKSVVGYGFHPTDQELLGHFLNLKLTHVNFDLPIAEVKVCDFEPWELPGQSKIKSGDHRVWFFFSPRDFKYAKSRRSNRKTKAGYWKPTGKPRNVKLKKKVIGTKRSLVFYQKEERTKWIMHEYELLNNEGNFVVCKLKVKQIGKIDTGEPKIATAAVSPCESGITVDSNCVEGDSSEHAGSHVEDRNLNDTSPASTSNRGEQICSDFHPKQNEVTADSACNKHNPDGMNIMASNDEGEWSFLEPLGNLDQIEVAADSVLGESELGFNLAPQTSDETTASAMSSYKTNEPNCIVTSGIRNRNSDWESYVSFFEDGEWSSLAETSDHGASACYIADMLTPSYGLESNAAEVKSFELQGIPTFFDQVNSMFEMEYGLLPSGSEECLSHTSLNTFQPSGTGSGRGFIPSP